MVWTAGVIAASFYAAGVLTGFYLAGKLRTPSKSQARLSLSAAITIVWMVAVLMEIRNPDAYPVPWPVHGLMGAVAGFYFKQGNPFSSEADDE